MNPTVRALALKVQELFNDYPSSVPEHNLRFGRPDLHPIFIVGAPRTGSTLLYQLMVKHMRVSFISNVMALVPKYMLIIAQLTQYWMHRISDVRKADVGYIPGLFRPSEAGAIMRKWFEEIPVEERRLVRNTVIILSDILDAPFINKNLLNSLRLDIIYAIFPEARFIHIVRNPLFVAQSILLTRRDSLGDPGTWLGPKPKEYVHLLNSDPAYQVLWQITEINKNIENFFDEYAPDHLRISYERLCGKPNESLRLIADRFNLKRESVMPVDTLSVQEEIKLSELEWERLIDYALLLCGKEIQ